MAESQRPGWTSLLLRLGSKYWKFWFSLGGLSLDIQVDIGMVFRTIIFLPIDRKEWVIRTNTFASSLWKFMFIVENSENIDKKNKKINITHNPISQK